MTPGAAAMFLQRHGRGQEAGLRPDEGMGGQDHENLIPSHMFTVLLITLVVV